MYHEIYIMEFVFNLEALVKHYMKINGKKMNIGQWLWKSCLLLPPFQIIRHSNNLGESKFFMFDQIYIIE